MNKLKKRCPDTKLLKIFNNDEKQQSMQKQPNKRVNEEDTSCFAQ